MSASKTRTNLLLGFAALASLGLGVIISQFLSPVLNDSRIPPGTDATVLPQARPLQLFQLLDHDNKPFGVEQLKGRWSFLFFGFTRCPDVCPTTLAVLQQVWKQLPGKAGDKGHPQMIFVSVDPDRDTLSLLKPYVQFYHPEFIGITGELSQIDNLTRQVNILYGYDEKADAKDEDYIVNHSAQILLIDPKGRWRAVFSPPLVADAIARNFQVIREFYGD